MRPIVAVVVAALALASCSAAPTTPSPSPTASVSASGSTGSAALTDPETAPDTGGADAPPVVKVTGTEVEITGSARGEVSIPVSGSYYLATLTTDAQTSVVVTIKGRELPSITGIGRHLGVFRVPEGQGQVTLVIEPTGGAYSLRLTPPPPLASAKPAPVSASGSGWQVTPVVSMPERVGVTFTNAGSGDGLRMCVALVYEAATGTEVLHVNLSAAGATDTQYNENVKGSFLAVVSCADPWRLDFLG